MMGAIGGADEHTLRQDLAAAWRLGHRFGCREPAGNHFSAAVSADGKRFLLHQKWLHFAGIKASDLLLDADHASGLDIPMAPDASVWAIHGTVHRQVPGASVGPALHILTDAVAADTAVDWKAYRDMAPAHFDDLKSELDRDNPSWRN